MPLSRIIALLIGLGVGFRMIGLGDRVYWVDEVATSIRISGYTKAQLITLLSDAVPRTPAELQSFLHPAPDLSWLRVLDALSQSPEHAPLYFLLAYAWTLLWGSSVVALRSLSVLWSLVALGLMGQLSSRLFHSPRAGAIAIALLALSPFFVAYAQEARPYSLWSALLLWSGIALLEAMRRPSENRWLHYSLCAALALYTSLLSVFVLLGQGLYVLTVGDRKQRQGYVRAIVGAGVAFLPWMLVILSRWSVLQSNTEWMRQPMDVLPLFAIWVYNTSVLLFDVPATLSPDLLTAAKLLTSVLLIGLMAIALSVLQRRTHPRVWKFILLLACINPIVLIGLDLLGKSQLSTAARYLLPFHLGMILALSFFLNHLLEAKTLNRQRLGQGLALLLIALCCLSYGFQLQQPPKYQKSRNLHNRAIATLINQATAPRLIAEPLHVMDLMSLSLDVQPSTQIQLAANVGEKPLADSLALTPCQPVFLLNPSRDLKAAVQQTVDRPLQEVYRPQKLVPNELALSLWKRQEQCPSEKTFRLGSRPDIKRAAPNQTPKPQLTLMAEDI